MGRAQPNKVAYSLQKLPSEVVLSSTRTFGTLLAYPVAAMDHPFTYTMQASQASSIVFNDKYFLGDKRVAWRP